jgi:hypothetical protein
MLLESFMVIESPFVRRRGRAGQQQGTQVAQEARAEAPLSVTAAEASSPSSDTS